MARILTYLLSLVLLAWSAVLVPMPFVEFAPGSARDVTDLVQIEGVDTTPIDGELKLLTINVFSNPSLAETVQAWLAPSRDLEFRQNVIPEGIDRREYFRLQQQQFSQAFEVAAAVGLRQAGYEVTITSRPVVFSVLPGGPADGVLEAGDKILEVEGQEVESAETMIEMLRGLEMGDTVRLRVKRGEEEIDVEIEAGRVAGLDRPGVGILVETIASDIELPVDVTLGDSNIGGPSAGMMIAVTVYDLVSEDDLADGRVVAGTGTVSASGDVGPIGGIQEKVFAAADIGADLMLVPESQLVEARAVAPPGLPIVGVATIDEAIAALRDGP